MIIIIIIIIIIITITITITITIIIIMIMILITVGAIILFTQLKGLYNLYIFTKIKIFPTGKN